MWRELGKIFRLLGTTGDDCRCIVLVGAGKSFCAGIDFTDETFGFLEITNDDDDDVARKAMSLQSRITEMQSCLMAIEECPVPVVAAIHGTCVGAGLEIACFADIRLCSSETKFSIREVRMGLAAWLQQLHKICAGNISKVRELCYTGEDFNASEALRIGFVSRVSSSSSNMSVLDDAINVAKKITLNSPVAVHGTKLSLNYARDHSVREGLNRDALRNSAELMSKDLMESFAAISSSRGEIASKFEPLLPQSKL